VLALELKIFFVPASAPAPAQLIIYVPSERQHDFRGLTWVRVVTYYYSSI